MHLSPWCQQHHIGLIVFGLLMLGISNAKIIILGPAIHTLEGGSAYSDRAMCNHGDQNNRPYCAYQEGQPSGTTISISGIPQGCSTSTGKCSTCAGIDVKCFTNADCNCTSLIVNGEPATNPNRPDAIIYNMGRYVIHFRLSDEETADCEYENGGELEEGQDPCTRLLYVRDRTPPEITLKGDRVVILEGGQNFTDPGATGFDLVDGDMEYIPEPPCDVERNEQGQVTKFIGSPGKICRFAATAEMSIDNRDLGNQTIYYIALDTTNNFAQTTRTVILEDTIPPIITLCGPRTLVGDESHEAGTQYIDAWCTPRANPCVDSQQGQLTETECGSKSECSWVPGSNLDEDGFCFLQASPCFNHRSADACNGASGCRWCPRGVTAYDNVDRNPTDDVQVISAINVMRLDTYTITYRLTDTSGNVGTPVSRRVRVRDTVPPNITLLGRPEVEVEGATFYREMFASAFDSFEGDISHLISFNVDRLSNLNCNKTRGCGDPNFVDPFAPAGTSFLLTYSVTDTSGNFNRDQSRVTRDVVIIDTTIPVLELNGDNPMSVERGDNYQEPGALARDTLDDDHVITRSIRIGGDRVDTTAAAFSTFNISYEVNDAAGNPAVPLFREVIVVDSTPPILHLQGQTPVVAEAARDYTDRNVTAEDNVDDAIPFVPRFSSRIRSVVRRLDVSCSDTEYEVAPQSALVARECHPLTLCSSDQFERLAPTLTTDRQCQTVSPPCSLGPEYELSANTSSSDRICEKCEPEGVSVAPDTEYFVINRTDCFDVSPPLITVNLTWPSRSEIETVVYVNDSVMWLFDPFISDIVALDSTFDSRLFFNRTNYLPSHSANTNLNGNSTLPNNHNASSDPTVGRNVTIEQFIVTFNFVGDFTYTSTLNGTWHGTIRVRERPQFDSCHLDSDPRFDPTDTMRAPHVLASIATLERKYHFLPDVSIPWVYEGSSGLCRQLNLSMLEAVLFDYAFPPGSVAREEQTSRATSILVEDVDNTNGKFEVQFQPGSQWQRVLSSTTIAITHGLRLRFVPEPFFYGQTSLQWRITGAGSHARKYLATGHLQTSLRFVDEDTPPEDIVPTEVSSLVVNVEENFRLTDYNISIGIAVVSVDNRFGVWQFACPHDSSSASGSDGGAPSILQFQSFTDGSLENTPSEERATLLAPACVVRFVPSKNFNTEIDLTGEPRPASDQPTIWYRAWGRTLFKDPKFEEGMDTTDHPGEDGSPFSSNIVMADIFVFNTDDPPNIVISKDGGEFHTRFVPGSTTPVPFVDPDALRLITPDGPVLSEIRIRVRNVRDGPAERVVFDTAGTGLTVTTELVDDTILANIRLSNVAEARRNQGPFFAVLGSMGYIHDQSNATRGERVVSIQAVLGRAPGELAFATVLVDADNNPPILNLDPSLHGQDAFVTYNQPGTLQLLIPGALVADKDGDSIVHATISFLDKRLDREELHLFTNSSGGYVVSIDDSEGAITIAPASSAPSAIAALSTSSLIDLLQSLEYIFPAPLPTTTNPSVGTTEAILTTRVNGTASNMTSPSTTSTTTSTFTTTTTTFLELEETRTVIITISDGKNLTSARIHVAPRLRDLPPFLDLQGQGQIGVDTLGTYTAGMGPLILAPEAVLITPGGQQIRELRVGISSSEDCLDETLSVPDSLATNLESLSFEVESGQLIVQGTQSLQEWHSVVRSVSFTSYATILSGNRRTITFQVMTDNGISSNIAVVHVRMRSRNVPPVLHPSSGPRAITVMQDISDWENTGWLVRDLIGSVAPRELDARPRAHLLECEGGCSHQTALDMCFQVDMQLCSHSDILEAWPNIIHSGLGDQQTPVDVVAWLSSSQDEADEPASLADRSNTKHGIKFQDDSLFAASQAQVLHAYTKADQPRFTFAAMTDRHLGLPLRAACCRLPENKQGGNTGLEAIAVFRSAQISGRITFRQRTATSPTQVFFSLRGVGRNRRQYGIYSGITTTTVARDTCMTAGQLFDPQNFGDCTSNSQTCAIGDLSGRFGLFPESSSSFDHFFTDSNLPLFGDNTIIGRTFAIIRNERPDECVPILPSLTRHETYATAVFDGRIRGTTTFRQFQARDGILSDAYVLSTLALVNVPSINAQFMPWGIVSGDPGTCSASAATYDIAPRLRHRVVYAIAELTVPFNSAWLSLQQIGPRNSSQTTFFVSKKIELSLDFQLSQLCVEASFDINPILIESDKPRFCIYSPVLSTVTTMASECANGSASTAGWSEALFCDSLVCIASGVCKISKCFSSNILQPDESESEFSSTTNAEREEKLLSHFLSLIVAVHPDSVSANHAYEHARKYHPTPLVTNVTTICSPIANKKLPCSEDPHSCPVGDWTKRHGRIRLFPSQSRSIRARNLTLIRGVPSIPSIFEDPSGAGATKYIKNSDKVMLQVQQPDGTFACGQIIEQVKPRQAIARIDINGILGFVSFYQADPLSLVQVRIDLRGTGLVSDQQLSGASVQITENTIDITGLSLQEVCQGLGNVFNRVNINTSACSMANPQNCAPGDLVGKHGVLPMQGGVVFFEDSQLTLYGSNSIVGRAVHVFKSDVTVACGVIVFTDAMRVARATLHAPLNGYVTVMQLRDDGDRPVSEDDVETIFIVDLVRSDGAEVPVDLDWSLRKYERACSCQRLGRVIQSGSTDVGNLSRHFGKLTVAPTHRSSANHTRQVFTTTGLPFALLANEAIYFSNDACGVLHEVETLELIARLDGHGAWGEVKLEQEHMFAPTRVLLNFNGLNERARLVLVQERRLVDNLDEEGRTRLDCRSGNSLFDPTNINRLCTNEEFLSSSDACAYGDLSGRYTGLEDQNRVQQIYDDYSLNLFAHNSLASRGVIITDTTGLVGQPWICANLDPVEKSHVTEAAAVFSSAQPEDVLLDDALQRPEPATMLPDGPGGGILSGWIRFSKHNVAPMLVSSFLEKHSTQWRITDWFVSSADSCQEAIRNVSRVIFNPHQVSIDNSSYSSHCGVGQQQLRCAVGDFGNKIGLDILNTGPSLGWADINAELTGRASIIGRPLVIELSRNDQVEALCAEIRPYRGEKVTDVDTPKDRLGVAIVAKTEEHGTWQLHQDSDDGWVDLPEVSLDNALHLRASDTNRVRFRPQLHFNGDEACDICPTPRRKSCTPCALNRTVGSLSFYAWDSFNAVSDGTKFSLASKESHNSYSTLPGQILAQVADAGVNETAPHGTLYEIDFNTQDDVGNRAITVHRQVMVKDQTSPILTVRGELSMRHEGGTPYVDQGATAFDSHDIWLNNRVIVDSITNTISQPPSPPFALQLLDCTQEVEHVSGLSMLYNCTNPSTQQQETHVLTSFEAQTFLCVDTNGVMRDVLRESELKYQSTLQCVFESGKMLCYSPSPDNLPLQYVSGVQDTTVACSRPVRDPICTYHTILRQRRHRYPVSDEVEVFAPDGSTFSIRYSVTDAAGNLHNSTRIVEIEDTIPPALRPATQGNTLEFVRNDGVAAAPDDPHDFACATTKETRFTEINSSALHCVFAADTLEGDLSCDAQLSVMVFNPTSDMHTFLGPVRLVAPMYPNSEIFVQVNESCVSWNPDIAFPSSWEKPSHMCSVRNGTMNIVNASLPLNTSYLITYSVMDHSRRKHEVKSQRLVVVVDERPPQVHVSVDKIWVAYLTNFTREMALSGVSAFDEHDGDVTQTIDIETNLNTAVPGTYLISYTAEDLSGNRGVTAVRTVVVEAPPKYTPIDNGAVVSATMLFKFMLWSDFMTFEGHTVFRSALLRTIRLNTLHDFSNLTGQHIVNLEGEPAMSEDDSSRRRRSDSNFDSTSVSFSVETTCDRADALAAVVSRVTRLGLLFSNLSIIAPLRFDGVAGQLIGAPAQNLAECPVFTTTTIDPSMTTDSPSSSSSGAGDAAIISAIVIPVVILLAVIVYFVFRSTRPKNKLGMLLEQQQMYELASMTAHQQQQLYQQSDGMVQVGNYQVRIQKNEVCGNTCVEKEDIYSFHTPKNALSNPHKSKQEMISNHENDTAVNPLKTSANFFESKPETYEAFDSKRSAFEADASLRPSGFQSTEEGIYDGSDAHTMSGFSSHDRT
eukprot:gene918-4179_t